MPTTTNYSLEYPSGASNVDMATHIQALAEDVDASLLTMLPKAGGTLTGALAGTSLNLSTTLAVTGLATFNATNGLEFGSSGPREISGSGSPLSVVSAPVGSTYRNTAGGQGDILWVKTSGTGSSGWVVKYGDTGWRGISTWDAAGTVTGQALGTHAAPTAGQAGGIYLRRVNDTIIVYIKKMTTSGSVNPTILSAGWNPTGFAAYATYIFHPVVTNLGGTATPIASIGTSAASGYLQAAGVSNPQTWDWCQYSYATVAAWPTSLPGASATP